MTLTDYQDVMLCKMPRDPELQFAAMATLQSYVAGFKDKIATGSNLPAGTVPTLLYAIDMPAEDLARMYRAGVRLSQAPVPLDAIGQPNILLNFGDDLLATQAATGRHASQFCCQLCGVLDRPFPAVPQVKPKLPNEGKFWGVVSVPMEGMYFGPGEAATIDGEAIIQARDGQFSGIIGYAGWETYLACSKGLPTIEIMPEGRHRTWLSKWSFRLYRVISAKGAARDLVFYVDQACKNIEQVVDYLDKAGKL